MIQVINRAFDILEYIAKDPHNPKVLGDIATELNLNAGTCANILKTMVHRNYIQKVDKQKGYILGSMSHGFTGYETRTKNLMEAAKEELQKLTKLWNENTVLGILKEDKRVVVVRAHANHDLQATTATEKRAYASSTGRLLVAMLAPHELQNFITKYGLPTAEEWPDAVDKKNFSKQILQIQEEGYAVQLTKGQIIGLAVAVFAKKNVIASLSVYMPIARYNKQPGSYVKLLNTSAKKIEKALK